MDINFNSVSLFLLVHTFPVKILSCEGEDRHCGGQSEFQL